MFLICPFNYWSATLKSFPAFDFSLDFSVNNADHFLKPIMFPLPPCDEAFPVFVLCYFVPDFGPTLFQQTKVSSYFTSMLNCPPLFSARTFVFASESTTCNSIVCSPAERLCNSRKYPVAYAGYEPGVVFPVCMQL